MKRIDDILDNLKEVETAPYDEDAMTDLIMSRIDETEQKPSKPKVIRMAPRWLIVLRNVSSAAAIAIICLTAWNFTETTTSTSNIIQRQNYISDIIETGNEAPGILYAKYLQRKESRKNSFTQLIKNYHENN